MPSCNCCRLLISLPRHWCERFFFWIFRKVKADDFIGIYLYRLSYILSGMDSQISVELKMRKVSFQCRQQMISSYRTNNTTMAPNNTYKEQPNKNKERLNQPRMLEQDLFWKCRPANPGILQSAKLLKQHRYVLASKCTSADQEVCWSNFNLR